MIPFYFSNSLNVFISTGASVVVPAVFFLAIVSYFHLKVFLFVFFFSFTAFQAGLS